MACKMCGACCRVVSISANTAKIAEMYERESMLFNEQKTATRPQTDISFIYENWTEITREQAILINPMLESFNSDSAYYTCKQFDVARNICNVHDTKPQVCAGYPWYGRQPSQQHWYARDCGYIQDIVPNNEGIPKKCDTETAD